MAFLEKKGRLGPKSRYWEDTAQSVSYTHLWLASTYNGLVKQNELIDGQWAQVENQLQRRHDLIPNLVSTVKGYAKHEEDVFTAIADARAKLNQASTVEERVEARNEVESALARLLVIVENYPELKADTQFNKLMDELSGAENRISVERLRFNEQVKAYNTKVKQFPTAVSYTHLDVYKRQVFGKCHEQHC